MLSKVFPSFDAAVADVPDGASIMFSGFAAPGTPQNLIAALLRQGARNLVAISNRPGGRRRGSSGCRGRRTLDRGAPDQKDRLRVHGADPGHALLRIDMDATQAAQVDDHRPLVTAAVADHAVPATADGDLEPVGGREGDGRGHVAGIGDTDDGEGPALVGRVPDAADVVGRVAGAAR